ncbi:hypothetical protein LTS08_000585 [Lithohypha guttulata]|nr:hypothetical protein LTS08_000585 [Lithohypha guttulata]
MSNTSEIPMPEPTNKRLPLSQYQIISFDVYGTLIQYKQHILSSFKPLLSRLPTDSPLRNSTPLSSHISDSATTGDIEFLKIFQKQEDTIKLELASNPLRFDKALQEIWRRVAAQLGVTTTDEEVQRFGSEENIKSWPCFPGSIEALQVIQSASSGHKLVALSNIDKYATDLTFAASGLGNISWSKVYTAEDFGTSEEDLKLADQRKFEALLKYADDIGCSKERILHVAQSLGHDHAPAKKMGVSSVFLTGDGPVWGKEGESRMAVEKGLVGYGWRCEDLREFSKLIKQQEEQ